MRRDSRSPSIWAFVLIGIGIIWLLFEAHVINGANLAVLFRLWPVVLIALGVELLFGRNSRALSLLIGLASFVVVIVLMFVGPSIGLGSNVEIKSGQYSEPLGSATTAQINLDLSVGSATVQAGSADKLIDADLRYIGDVTLDVSGSGSEKYVTLSAENDSTNGFDFLGLSLADTLNEQKLYWNVSLNPDIPLDLSMKGGVGETTLDLNDLQVSRLSYNGGVGETTINLPDTGSYDLDLKGGVGKTRISFAAGAGVNADINAGVGEVVLDLPEGAAVRIETKGGLGNMSVPLPRISGGDDESVWQSENYASADAGKRITIHFEGGIGGLSVQ
jgi:hypothetical protein